MKFNFTFLNFQKGSHYELFWRITVIILSLFVDERGSVITMEHTDLFYIRNVLLIQDR